MAFKIAGSVMLLGFSFFIRQSKIQGRGTIPQNGGFVNPSVLVFLSMLVFSVRSRPSGACSTIAEPALYLPGPFYGSSFCCVWPLVTPPISASGRRPRDALPRSFRPVAFGLLFSDTFGCLRWQPSFGRCRRHHIADTAFCYNRQC